MSPPCIILSNVCLFVCLNYLPAFPVEKKITVKNNQKEKKDKVGQRSDFVSKLRFAL